MRDMARFLSLTLLLVLGAVFAGGCTMIPEYRRNQLPVDGQWPVNTGVTSENAGDGENTQTPHWREVFTDPAIVTLVETAIANNRDLRVALINIEKVRSQYYIQRADILPTINAVGGGSGQYVNRHYSQTGSPMVQHQYQANVGFTSFELDIFGRIRSLNESALQQYLATEEAAKAVQVSLVGEVVTAYLNLTADKEIRSLAKSTYANRKRSYNLIKRKADMGLSSLLEVNQARTIMEEARVTAAIYETRVAQGHNALVFLLGAVVPPEVKMAEKLKDIKRLPELKPGMPADLLQRRPDIIGAERRLLSMNANIGAARANFFPRISLTSNIGTLAPEFGDLFTSGAGSWLFQPQAVLPIFDTGRNISILKGAKADRDMAVATYEKTIQGAFREVADALAQRANIDEQMAGQLALLKATGKSYRLSNQRYEIGLDSYINLLDAQRSFFNAQQAYINTVLLRESNTVNLYKALGGGWDEIDEEKRKEQNEKAKEAAAAAEERPANEDVAEADRDDANK